MLRRSLLFGLICLTTIIRLKVKGQGRCTGIGRGFNTAPGPQYDAFILHNTLQLSQCCAACRIIGSCEAFVYNSFTKICYLKNATAPRIWEGGSLSTISGSPNSPAWSGSTRRCQSLTQGLNISPGANDLYSIPNTTVSGCCDACNGNTNCMGWVFNLDTHICYLKSEKSPWTLAGMETLSGLPGNGLSTVQGTSCSG